MPLNVAPAVDLATVHHRLGDTERAAEELERAEGLVGDQGGIACLQISMAMSRGDGSFLRDLLAERSAEAPDSELAALGEVLDAPETACDRLPELSAMSRAPVRLAYWAAFFGEPDIAAELVRSATIGGPLLAQYFWEPIMRDARRTETFKQTMRDLGLVDFWRARLAHGMPPDAGRRLRVRLRKGASTRGQMAGH